MPLHRNHPNKSPRGVRNPRDTVKQAGGTLVWLENGQPMVWVDRPFKFASHIKVRLAGWEKRDKHVVMQDIKWRQLGSDTWWRIPDWPDGFVTTQLTHSHKETP
jgi:hypothetical protein